MFDPDYNPVVPSHVPPELVHDYNVFDYESHDPHLAEHALLQSGLPEVIWTRNNGGHWLVTGAQAATELSADAVLFSTTRLMLPDSANSDTPSFPPLDVDPPMHREYRNVIAPLFTPPRIALVELGIRQVTNELIATIKSRGECEFVEDFASQMPVVVFLKLLDLPLEDRAKLRAIAHRITHPIDDGHRAKPLEDLSDYIRPIVEDRFANPRNDAISSIVSQKVNGRPMTFDEMEKISRTVLLSGLDTVTSTLTFFARFLADSPDVRRLLRDDPTRIKPAIEEIIRRYPVANIGRVVMQDTVFRGVTMKKGDHAFWPVGMYNFDERRYPNAMHVDLDRKRQPHASFGVGEHFCVGSMLARAEIGIFMERWLAEIPDFYVKPCARIQYRGGFVLNYRALPLIIGKPPVAGNPVSG